MKQRLSIAGSGLGTLGALLCALGVGIRSFGYFTVLGFEPMTLFQAGVGLMVGACLLKLVALESSLRRDPDR